MKILPINITPLLKTYQNTALPLAAVSCGTHEEDIVKYCINHFIQLRYHRNRKMLDFWHSRYSDWYCIEVQNTLRNDFFNICNLSILEIIKNAIDQNLYVYTIVNEFYIPERNRYQKEYYPHDILIYGYNEDGVIALGYNDRLVLSPVTVPYSMFIEAVQSVQHLFFIDFFTYASYNAYTINMKQIECYLKDYIYSENSDYKYKFMNTDSICSYGINAIFEMFHHEKTEFESNGNLDFRNFDCYYEHKRMMQLRIQSVGQILGDDQYNVEYKIKNDAFIIRNLALKAKKLKELKIIEDIENRIKNNVEQEIVLLSELLLKISQNI